MGNGHTLRAGLGLVAAAVGAVAVGQWLGRAAGSTHAERRRPLPGDELVDRPTVVTNHATTIPAPPELAGTGDGGTRLLLRVRGRTRPWWLTAAYVAALVPADYVMASSMLEGIRRRALQPAPLTLPGWWCGGRGRRPPRPGGPPRAWSGCWTRSS